MRPRGIGRAFPAAVALSLLVAGVITGLVPQADKRQVIIAQDFLDLVITYSLTDLTDIYEHGMRHGAGSRADVDLMGIGEDNLAAKCLRLYIVKCVVSFDFDGHMCSGSAQPERHGSAAQRAHGQRGS